MGSENRIFNGDFEDYEWLDETGERLENNRVEEFLEKNSQNIIKESITKYMPIGSVVRLKNKIGLHMIVGYKYKNNDIEFDYLSAKYPGGITNNDKINLFNHEDIEKIHHIGMTDGIQREYKKSLLGESEGFNKTL